MREFSVAFAALFLVSRWASRWERPCTSTIACRPEWGDGEQQGRSAGQRPIQHGIRQRIGGVWLTCVGGDVDRRPHRRRAYSASAHSISARVGGRPGQSDHHPELRRRGESPGGGHGQRASATRGRSAAMASTNAPPGSACSAVAGEVNWHAWYKINNGTERKLVLDHQSLASCAARRSTRVHGNGVSSGNMCVNIDGATSPRRPRSRRSWFRR